MELQDTFTCRACCAKVWRYKPIEDIARELQRWSLPMAAFFTCSLGCAFDLKRKLEGKA